MVQSYGLGQFRYSASSVPANPPLSWKPLKVGGGGLTRDLDFANDGSEVAKIDVFGAYIRNMNVLSTGNAGGMGLWQQLFAPGRIPPGDPSLQSASDRRFLRRPRRVGCPHRAEQQQRDLHAHRGHDV
jgi:hypothetical protein